MTRLLAFCLAAAACDLQEVTIADSEDVIVAEITLRAGENSQRAWLHRTLADGRAEAVPNARVEVRGANGVVMTFRDAGTVLPCLENGQPQSGSCYLWGGPQSLIVPGETYTLRIQTADGRELTSSTRVPADFQLRRPSTSVCSIEANKTFPIEWSVSPGAWVYVSEALFFNLEPFLQSRGITLKESPVRAFGLSLSNQDTTVVFPTQLGIFQRFDPDLTKALVAIQNGLPQDANAEVLVAAADRNYVNWERGGNFNPSGLIRVPSIRGDGTGTFGSIVPRKFTVVVGRPALAPC